MRLLVIDDLEQLDELKGTRERLMHGLAMLSDQWDTVVVAGACKLHGVEGWKVIDLDPEPEASPVSYLGERLT